MFWKKKKSRQTAIRFIKTYNDIVISDDKIYAPEKQTLQRLNGIKENTTSFIWNIKLKDNLLKEPKVKITDIKEDKENIIAQIDITYTTHIAEPRMNPIFGILWFLFAWSVLGFIVSVYHFDNHSKIAQIDAQCYYYTKNGIPSSIEADDVVYKLDSNGRINEINRTFLNPYHEQLFREGKCDIINIGEKK